MVLDNPEPTQPLFTSKTSQTLFVWQTMKGRKNFSCVQKTHKKIMTWPVTNVTSHYPQKWLQTFLPPLCPISRLVTLSITPSLWPNCILISSRCKNLICMARLCEKNSTRQYCIAGLNGFPSAFTHITASLCVLCRQQYYCSGKGCVTLSYL